MILLTRVLSTDQWGNVERRAPALINPERVWYFTANSGTTILTMNEDVSITVTESLTEISELLDEHYSWRAKLGINK